MADNTTQHQFGRNAAPVGHGGHIDSAASGLAACAGFGGVGAGGEAPLGTYTNTSSAFHEKTLQSIDSIEKIPFSRVQAVDPETGEILDFVQHVNNLIGLKQTFNPRASRALKFERLAAARNILGVEHRTSKCLWCRFSNADVQVLKDSKLNVARYSGLIACSRVWTCPVCSSKISVRRAGELKAAMVQAKALGLHVALLTVTVPHHRTDALKPLLDGLLKAWRSFTSDRRSLQLREEIGLVGTVRNIEATHGANGWHPHFHCLVFYKNDVDLAVMQEDWGKHWQHCAVKAGLRKPSMAHGLTVQNGDFASAYVSKWGIEHEMTLSMAKTARVGGRNPWHILDDFNAGIDVAANAALFREFSDAFHRKQQLFWSPGLKKLLAVADKTDEEVVQEEDARPAEFVVQISWPVFKLVRRKFLAHLLNLAETAPGQVVPFLEKLSL